MVRKKRALARTSAHDEALIGSILDMRGDDSFVLDTDGADLPPEPEPEPEPGAGVQKDERGLVLPSHVQFVPMDVEMEQDADADADGDGDGDGDGFTENVPGRYYAEQTDEGGRKICPVCGEEGHVRRDCPHEHCLACGALDEHSTKSCPLSTSCFRCGGQGHRSRDCTRTRRSARDCGRCGSYAHAETTCPTLWRLYTYSHDDEVRAARARRAHKMRKRHTSTLPFHSTTQPEHVSDDELDPATQLALSHPPPSWDPAERWCYNCAVSNHWGDECPERRCNPTPVNGEPSAFSEFVSRWGPHSAALPRAPPIAGSMVPARTFDFRPPAPPRPRARDTDAAAWNRIADDAAAEFDDDWFARHARETAKSRSEALDLAAKLDPARKRSRKPFHEPTPRRSTNSNSNPSRDSRHKSKPDKSRSKPRQGELRSHESSASSSKKSSSSNRKRTASMYKGGY